MNSNPKNRFQKQKELLNKMTFLTNKTLKSCFILKINFFFNINTV